MSPRIAALRIDFRRRARTAQPRLGWLVLVAGATLFGGAYAELSNVETQVASARTSAKPAASLAAGSGDSPQGARQRAETTRAEGLARAQLATPWDALLGDIEQAASEDIALLALQAGADGRTLTVSGEARDFAGLMAYVRRLQAGRALAEVHLTGHERRRDDPQQPVAFALSASWAAAR